MDLSSQAALELRHLRDDVNDHPLIEDSLSIAIKIEGLLIRFPSSSRLLGGLRVTAEGESGAGVTSKVGHLLVDLRYSLFGKNLGYSW